MDSRMIGRITTYIINKLDSRDLRDNGVRLRITISKHNYHVIT